MFFWFLACGVLVVLFVFDSPAVDYRFVAAGSVLPVAETATGAPWLLHTLLGAAALLVAVMAATAGRGRRLARRRWLGVPIGVLVFLAASGSWSRAALFWWPLGGAGGVGQGPPPELDRPLGVILALEAAGLLALAWLVTSRGLASRRGLRALLATGRLPRPDRSRAPNRSA